MLPLPQGTISCDELVLGVDFKFTWVRSRLALIAQALVLNAKANTIQS